MLVKALVAVESESECEALLEDIMTRKELLDIANKAFSENGLSTLEAGFRNGGSDAADVTAFGIPCIDSIGVCGERAHSKEEYGIITSLPEAAKRLASIILAL